MKLAEFLKDNYTFAYELVGLLIMLNISVFVSERMKQYNQSVIALMAIETAIFHLERWTQSVSTLSVLRPLLTAAMYSLYPLILLLIMQVTTTRTLSKKRFLLLLIPELVSIPLFFTSQWTHLIFYFHEENVYSGGVPVLQYWPYALFGFYVIVFMVHNFICFRSYAKKTLWILGYIMVVPMIGVLCYILLDIDRDYNALFLSAILLYYLYVYIYKTRTDPLTTLQNRQSYYKLIETESRTITGVVSVDMNDLKYLNDNLGHGAGDKALQTVSVIMRDHCGHGGNVYRVGGDEFMILYIGAEEQSIADAISTMKAKMEETDYRCAFGYAMRRPDEKIEETIRRSDERMYAQKAEMKEKRQSGSVQAHGGGEAVQEGANA